MLVPVYLYIKKYCWAHVDTELERSSNLPEVTCESTFERQEMNYRISVPQPRMFSARSWGVFYCLIACLCWCCCCCSCHLGGFVCLFLLQVSSFFENIHPYGQKMSFFMKELERKEEGGSRRGKVVCWIFWTQL